MIKRFFKGLLIFILGMIFGIVALFGGIYLAATKVKVKDIASLAGFEDAIGEDLAELSLVETVVKLADTNTTIGTYFEYFPTLNDGITDLVNNGDLGKFVQIDLEELKSYTISNVGDKVMDAVSIVVSLDTLSKDIGFELPDNMPIFKTAENGGYADYIKITPDGKTEITNKYYEDRKENIYYKSGEEYVKAYNADGTLVSSATAPFYYKGCLVDIPVTDAITGLSNILNFDTLTFKDLQDKIGVDIFGEEDSLIKKIINEEDTLGSISKSLMDNVNKLTLGDFDITISADDGVISKIIDSNTKIGSLTGADGYDELDFAEKINSIKLSEMGITFEDSALNSIVDDNTTIGDLKKKDFKEEVNNIKLTALGLNLTSDDLLGKIFNVDDTVGTITADDFDINARIETLTMADVDINFNNDTLLSQIIKSTDTIKDLKTEGLISDRIDGLKLEDLGFNFAEGSIASKVISSDDTIADLKDGTKINNAINSLKLVDLGVNLADDVVGSILYTDDTIETLKVSGVIRNRINNLKISQLITNTDNNALLNALTEKGATVGTLSSTISELTFTDVYTSAKVFVSSTETTKTNSNYMSFTKDGDNYVQSTADNYVQSTADNYFISSDAGIWLMLLYKKTGTYGEFTYTFNDMNLLEFGNNVSGENGLTSSFSTCTMQELYEVGIINEKPTSETIAKLTLTEVISKLNGNS